MLRQIFTFLDNAGAPKTGLTVSVVIYDLTNDTSDTQNCVELANGIYVLEHADYVSGHDYVYFADAGSSIANRYSYATNGSFSDDIVQAIDSDSTRLSMLERMQRASLILSGTQITLTDEIGPIQVWNCEDENGDPSGTRVFSRLKA